MEKKIISVVINYNDINRTLECVQSLLLQTAKTKIVVWDNNSTDNSVQILLNTFGSQIVVIGSTKNIYWSPAVNKALEATYDNEDYIHYTNNDIVYPRESLERMIADLEATGSGMVGPTGSAIGGLQDYHTHHSHKDGMFQSFEEFYTFLSGRKPTQASSIQGACVVMPRKVWIKTGCLDENMPLGADDFDISIRVKELGYKLHVSEQAYVSHVGHASGHKAREEWTNMGHVSWDYFNKKWNGYYFNELEALRCMWEHKYYENWDTGTGWLSEEMRKEIWNRRGVDYDGNEL